MTATVLKLARIKKLTLGIINMTNIDKRQEASKRLHPGIIPTTNTAEKSEATSKKKECICKIKIFLIFLKLYLAV